MFLVYFRSSDRIAASTDVCYDAPCTVFLVSFPGVRRRIKYSSVAYKATATRRIFFFPTFVACAKRRSFTPYLYRRYRRRTIFQFLSPTDTSFRIFRRVVRNKRTRREKYTFWHIRTSGRARAHATIITVYMCMYIIYYTYIINIICRRTCVRTHTRTHPFKMAAN